jgi:hypothetical protein
MFKYKGGYFTNIKNSKVVSIKDRKDVEAQPVWASTRLGGNHPSQRWKIVYTNAMGSEAYKAKGQTDGEFGFKIGEVFYLRSKLPMQRVAECVGASNVTLKKWAKGRKAQ